MRLFVWGLDLFVKLVLITLPLGSSLFGSVNFVNHPFRQILHFVHSLEPIATTIC